MTVGTFDCDAHSSSAAMMMKLHRRSLRVGLPLVAPLHQGDHDREEVEALLGEAVLVAGPAPGSLVGGARQNAGGVQRRKTVAEDAARAAAVAAKLLEAAGPVERFAQDGRAPALITGAEWVSVRA